MSGLINFLQSIFVDKAPALPEGFKSFVVKFVPYVVIIAIIFIGISLFSIIPVFLFAVGFANAVSKTGTLFSPMLILTTVFALVNAVLLIMAIPGLFKKTLSGWTYVFYASLLGIVLNILTVSVVSLVLSLVALYILFQIRSYYMGGGTASSMPPASPMPPRGY